MVNRQGQIGLGEAMRAGMFCVLSRWCFNVVQYMLGDAGERWGRTSCIPAAKAAW